MFNAPMISSILSRALLSQSQLSYNRVADRFSSLASLKIVDAVRMTKQETIMSEQVSTKVCIVGSGPAAHTAAIYTARAELSPIIFEGWMANGIAAGAEAASGRHVDASAFRNNAVLGSSQFENPPPCHMSRACVEHIESCFTSWPIAMSDCMAHCDGPLV